MNDFRETCRYCKNAERWDGGPMIFTCKICGLIGAGTLEPCKDFEERSPFVHNPESLEIQDRKT